jgi:hypothetical protein
MGFAALLTALAGISASVTLVVYIIRSIVDPTGKLPAVTWNILALVVGLGFCLGWEIDVTGAVLALIPRFAGDTSRLTGIAGQVLTGLTAGAFAGFGHEILDALRGIAGKGPRFVPAGTTVTTVEPTTVTTRKR